mgnify:CR=1 FL=1
MIKIVEELWGTFEELWGTLHIASGNWKNKRNMIPQSSSFLDQVSDSGTQETLRNLPQELEELWGTCLRNSRNSEEPDSGTRGTLRNRIFTCFREFSPAVRKVPQSSSEFLRSSSEELLGISDFPYNHFEKGLYEQNRTVDYSVFFLELSDFLRGPTQVRFLRFPVGGKKHPNFFSPAAGYLK